LVITNSIWYVLWTIYLAPEEVEEGDSLPSQLFVPLSLFLMLFLATSGLQLDMLKTVNTLPADYRLLEGLDRIYPWVIGFFLLYSAYYGAKQDYQRQGQGRSS
jgi:hypothetical protein